MRDIGESVACCFMVDGLPENQHQTDQIHTEITYTANDDGNGWADPIMQACSDLRLLATMLTVLRR